MKKKDVQNQRDAGPRKTKCVECQVCSSRISGGVAYFEFGALIDLLVLEEKGLSYTEMEGFCHIGYHEAHGADSDMSGSADYCVGDLIKGGQMEISFCSLACLRKWFSDIVDYLERESGQR